MPPKPATMTIATAASDKPLAQTIDCWLERISSSSITGNPVSPIVASPCRCETTSISFLSVSVATEAPAKPSSSLTKRNKTKPSFPSFAKRYWLERSRSVDRLPGILGHGET